jgi:hypothetical protein
VRRVRLGGEFRLVQRLGTLGGLTRRAAQAVLAVARAYASYFTVPGGRVGRNVLWLIAVGAVVEVQQDAGRFLLLQIEVAAQLCQSVAIGLLLLVGVAPGECPPQADGFLGGSQSLPVAADTLQADPEVVQRPGEVGLVGGGCRGRAAALSPGSNEVSVTPRSTGAARSAGMAMSPSFAGTGLLSGTAYYLMITPSITDDP